MSFFGNIINGIPVIGHAKGVVHLLANDEHGAKKAFSAATRSTAVIAGGVGGAIVGGPAGAVAGGIAAGTAMDCVSSVAKGKPQGVFSGIDDIAEDLVNGRVPVGSVLKTGIYIGSDALSGVSGGGIAANLPAKMGQNVLKDAVNIATKSATTSTYTIAAASKVSRDVAKHIEPSPYSSKSYSYSSNSGSNTSSSTGRTSNSSTSSSNRKTGENSESTKSTSGGGSGSDPPRNNKNNKKDHELEQKETLSHFDALLKIFGVSNFEKVIIRGIAIFKEITGNLPTAKAKKNRLKALIKELRENGTLERVIEAVKNILSKMNVSDITYNNFLNFCKMVSTYVGERLARRMEMQIRIQRETTPFHVRRAQNLAVVLQEILQPGSRNNILNIFTELRNRIQSAIRNFCPTFSSDIAATYHYYKHKFVPNSTDILTINDYMQLIVSSLPRILSSRHYSLLQNGQARRLVYDRFYAQFGRRVRIVLQVEDDTIVVSTCHILNDAFDGDYDGFETFETTK